MAIRREQDDAIRIVRDQKQHEKVRESKPYLPNTSNWDAPSCGWKGHVTTFLKRKFCAVVGVVECPQEAGVSIAAHPARFVDSRTTHT